MKRFYHNMSNETKVYRTWIINQDTIGEADFLWLKAFDIPIRVDAPSHEFTSVVGTIHHVYGRPTYTCDTTTDKQRDMLILKYGNNAILMQEEVVLPGTISSCVLSDIAW